MNHNLFLISLFIHLLAAITWIGGMLFLVMCLVPCLRHPDLRGQALTILQVTGRKFRNVGWACLLTLLITGFTNFLFKWGPDALGEPSFWKNPYAHILSTKLLLVLVIMILSAVHDFRIGPLATAAWEKDPQSAQTLSLRKKARLLGRVNLLLSVLVLVLAVLLSRGLPVFGG